MAGQGIDRRDMLRAMAVAAAAARGAGFSRWVFGGQETASPAGQADRYEPHFFTPEEYSLIEILAELIIPGAREAGAAEFVDFMVSSDSALQVPFRDGLRWLQAFCLQRHGRDFAQLEAGAQSELLVPLAYREHHQPGQEEGRTFFRHIRRYTAMGYYTSRAGMEELDSPFLQTHYSELPGCKHLDDPAHENLQPDPA